MVCLNSFEIGGRGRVSDSDVGCLWVLCTTSASGELCRAAGRLRLHPPSVNSRASLFGVFRAETLAVSLWHGQARVPNLTAEVLDGWRLSDLCSHRNPSDHF